MQIQVFIRVHWRLFAVLLVRLYPTDIDFDDSRWWCSPRSVGFFGKMRATKRGQSRDETRSGRDSGCKFARNWISENRAKPVSQSCMEDKRIGKQVDSKSIAPQGVAGSHPEVRFLRFYKNAARGRVFIGHSSSAEIGI